MLDLVNDGEGFDGFLNGDDLITPAVIDAALPRLKVIAKYGIGLDSIAVDYATEKKIPVLFTPGVNHTTVAEHAFGLMIGLAKHFKPHLAATGAGAWKRITGNELMGKTIGVIGMGRIGKEVIKRAQAFGMPAIAFDKYWDADFAAEWKVKQAGSAEEILTSADVVSLHMFLDASTENFINADSIAQMKDGAYLINTARGGLIDENAIAEACRNGKLGGYGTDVVRKEPMDPNHPFKDIDNIILTPHVGSRTRESVERQALRATNNLINFLAVTVTTSRRINLKNKAIPGFFQRSLNNISIKKVQEIETHIMTEFIMPVELHNALVTAAYQHRGFGAEESAEGARFCALASEHGIKTHNAIKALHLDELFGSEAGGCVPNAEIEKLPSKFAAVESWNANKKLGQATAFAAMERAIELSRPIRHRHRRSRQCLPLPVGRRLCH